MNQKNQNKKLLERVRILMEYNTSMTAEENKTLVEQKNYTMSDLPSWSDKTIPKKRDNVVSPRETLYMNWDEDSKTGTTRTASQVPSEEKKFLDILAKVNERRSVRYDKPVPEGYSPFSYDDYLDEMQTVNDYQNKVETLKSKPTKTQSDINYIRNAERWIQKRVDELEKKYYNPKFPKGVTPEDFEFFEAQKKNLMDEMKLLVQKASRGPNFTQQGSTTPGWFLRGMKDAKAWMSSKDKREYEDLANQLKDLEFKFGYDGRTAFDKFMDSNWGLAAQIFVNILLAVGGELTGGITWGILLDAAFNLSIGAYQWRRDQQSEAMMSFVFATLPYMRNLHRLAGFPSKAITDSIAQKLVGKSLKTSTEINSFLATLTKEEAEVWKKIAYLHPNKITPEVQQLINANKEMIKATKTKLERFGGGVKRFGKEALVDLTIAYGFSEVFDKVKEQLKKFNIPVKTQAELDRFKSWLQTGATSQQLQKVYEYSGYMLQENPQFVEELKKQGFSAEKFKNKILMYKPSQEAIRKKQEEIKKNPSVDKEFEDLLNY